MTTQNLPRLEVGFGTIDNLNSLIDVLHVAYNCAPGFRERDGIELAAETIAAAVKKDNVVFDQSAFVRKVICGREYIESLPKS